jgi:rhamnulokinase
LELPTDLLPTVFTPGTRVGPILPALREETGSGPVTIIAPAGHDTGSAVVAVPASDESWAYISSGTWFLVGRELRAPLRSRDALAANFTNECGLNGTIRFQKNVAGLWLLQECQRVWNEQGRQYTFDQLVALAAAAPPFAALVDPDDPSFAGFGDMPERIRAFCNWSGQSPPDSDGTLVRCIFESLALKCRTVIDELESLTGPIGTLHIVGGGAHNPLLCQLAADAAERPVLAGPVEATAVGNIMAQAMAHRAVLNLEDIRAVVAASFRPVRYDPRPSRAGEKAKARFRALLSARWAT